MIKKYLIQRTVILNDIIRTNKEKFEHNQIAIVKLNNQIKELNDTIDEASQIFSVKAREDNGFKKQEISEIENKIAVYVVENNELKKIIDDTENELHIVDNCLDELDKYVNVSRETFTKEDIDENMQLEIDLNNCKEENFENYSKCTINEEKLSDIINKLMLCKSIAEVDGKRVGIEIDNILSMIEE